MYASKRRQRNFKRIRETNRNVNLPTNPSKRHRERLNGELETVAGLLPYEDSILQRLDKLSVLRLAVSFLHIKAHFQGCSYSCLLHGGQCPQHPQTAFLGPVSMGGLIPSLVDIPTGVPLIDTQEPFFRQLVQKALGGFIIILSQTGEIYYVTENIETYLGFLQSDVLHQSLFEMIHSEDREDLKQYLQMDPTSLDNTNTTVVARFRCLLDNTCGFIRVEIKGKFMSLHLASLSNSSCIPPNQRLETEPKRYVLAAICTPFVPPLQMDPNMDDPILKTKHSLDLGISFMDNRLRYLLELDNLPNLLSSSSQRHSTNYPISFYSIIHPSDVKFVAEAHDSVIKYCSSGLLIYRMLSRLSGAVHYVQSNLRLFFKNGKPETIGGNHRLLTEVDGHALLEKRISLKFKYISFDDTLLQSPRLFQSTSQSNTTDNLSQIILGNNMKDEYSLNTISSFSKSNPTEYSTNKKRRFPKSTNTNCLDQQQSEIPIATNNKSKYMKKSSSNVSKKIPIIKNLKPQLKTDCAVLALKTDVLSQTAINNLAVDSEAFIPILNSNLATTSNNNQNPTEEWDRIKNRESNFVNKRTTIDVENNNLDMFSVNCYNNPRNPGTTDYIFQEDNIPSTINNNCTSALNTSALSYPLGSIPSVAPASFQYSNTSSEALWLQNPYSHPYYSSQNGVENHLQLDPTNLYHSNMTDTATKLNPNFHVYNGAYYPRGSSSSNWTTEYCNDLINPYANTPSTNPLFALHPNIETLIPSQVDLSKQLLSDAVTLQNASNANITSNLLDSANSLNNNLPFNVGTDYAMPNNSDASTANYDPVAGVVSVQSAAYAAHATGFNFFSEVANSLFGQ